MQQAAIQVQLKNVCMTHLLAAARCASFALRPELLECAVKAFWNTSRELMGTAEGRSMITEGLEELAGLLCKHKCPDANFQVLDFAESWHA